MSIRASHIIVTAILVITGLFGLVVKEVIETLNNRNDRIAELVDINSEQSERIGRLEEQIQALSTQLKQMGVEPVITPSRSQRRTITSDISRPRSSTTTDAPRRGTTRPTTTTTQPPKTCLPLELVCV